MTSSFVRLVPKGYLSAYQLDNMCLTTGHAWNWLLDEDKIYQVKQKLCFVMPGARMYLVHQTAFG